jgi:hypothetical protein
MIRDGRIASGPAPAGVAVADGRGGVLLPAFVDVHAHLDSTRLGLPFRPHTAEPGLAGLIANDRQNWRAAGGSVAERATRTLGAAIASGATTVRSHAQVDTDSGLERLEGVLAAREAHAGRADVQVVAFPQSGILRDPGTAELLDAAVRAGADLVGGLDPCAFDRDPVGHLDVVFGVAPRHGVGVDIHLHETGELGAFTIELIAERTAALGMHGLVTISHVAVGTVDAGRQGALIELLACRHRPRQCARQPRTAAAGGAAHRRVRSGWVRTASGSTGRPTATVTSWAPRRCWPFAGGFRHDALVELCVDVASRWASDHRRRDLVLGGDHRRHRERAGAGRSRRARRRRADTVTAAVMDHPPRTLVIHGGDVIARDGQLC